jgi:hypothetical protein
MPKPQMRTSSNGNCNIRHREYLKDIVAEGSSPSIFTSQGFPINPGMAQTFPWLSQIAPRFEKYHFKKLRFCFETEAPTSLGGSLILTLDYDASDAAPTSKVQAMAYKNAVRAAPWEECCHDSAAEDLSQQKQYFVRSGVNPVSTDIKLYDVGNLFVCSQNVVTGGATLGELYVEYDVELMTPQLQLPSIEDVDSANIIGQVGTTLLLPFGSAPVVTSSQLLPLVTIAPATGIVTFNRGGEFLLEYRFTGTGLTDSTITGTLAAQFLVNEQSIIEGGSAQMWRSSNTSVDAVQGDTIKAVAIGTSCTGAVLYISEYTL